MEFLPCNRAYTAFYALIQLYFATVNRVIVEIKEACKESPAYVRVTWAIIEVYTRYQVFCGNQSSWHAWWDSRTAANEFQNCCALSSTCYYWIQVAVTNRHRQQTWPADTKSFGTLWFYLMGTELQNHTVGGYGCNDCSVRNFTSTVYSRL